MPRPCPIGSGPGNAPSSARRIAKAVGSFEQALSALCASARAARHARAGHRPPARPAHGALPSGDLGRILAYLREAETLAVASTTRVGWDRSLAFLVAPFLRFMGAYDQAIAAASAPSRSPQPAGMSSCRHWRTYYLGLAYQAQGDYRRAIDYFGQTVASLDGARRHELFGNHPARRDLPCLPRLVPCRAGHVRRGQCPRGRRAADCRGG